MSRFKRVVEICDYALGAIAAAILFAMLVAVCVATISRYAFKEPMAFLIDLSGYALVFVAFLSAPWLMRNMAHVNVDVLINRSSEQGQKYWRGIVFIITGIVALAIAYPGAVITADFIDKGRVMNDVLKTPQWVLLLPIPVGCFFTAIQSFINAAEEFISLKTSRTASSKGAACAKERAEY